MTDKVRETKGEYLYRMTKKAFNGEFVANLYTTGTPEYNELEDAISRGLKMRYDAYNTIQSQSARIAELEAKIQDMDNIAIDNFGITISSLME